MKLFISFCSQDGLDYAFQLETDLKSQNVSTWISKENLQASSGWLRQIDNALYDVDFVLGVITEKYLESIGGDEAYATIAKDFNADKKKFIPCFFISPSNVKSVFIPSLEGFEFHTDYKKGLYELLKYLKLQVKEDARNLLSFIEGAQTTNPFRRVRTEFYYEDYSLLAKNFAEPEKEKYDMIREAKPIYLFGGRGSGKTMILKSLIPEVLISKLNVKNINELKGKGIDFFGLYFKLKKGASLIYDFHSIIEIGFLQTGLNKNYELYKELYQKLKVNHVKDDPILTAGINAVWVISLHEMNIKILTTFLREINRLRSLNFINIQPLIEKDISLDILNKLNLKLDNVDSFEKLILILDSELNKIDMYVQQLALPFSNPEINWTHTNQEFIDQIFEIFSKKFIELKDFHFYLLFDEFENLRPFQQTIINEWIKTAKFFSVKIASKYKGMYTNLTHQGQPIQDGQDYWSWELDYNLFDNKSKAAYQSLLTRMCYNILTNEGYQERDIKKLLDESNNKEVDQVLVDEEIKLIRQNGNLTFDINQIEEYRNKLELAATFRILRKKDKIEGRYTKKKIYAGFETYTYLSSGIIRIFLNLSGMALYKAEAEGNDIKNGKSISTKEQTWAAYIVSRAWLEKIPINLEEYGEKMYQFIVDIGSVFRERLLFHSTEPETITLSLTDPHNLDNNEILTEMIDRSVSESILYEKKESSAMKSKISIGEISRELLINRIYCPILEISYRPRWSRSCKIKTEELANLIDSNKRDDTRKNLQKRQHKIENENTFF